MLPDERLRDILEVKGSKGWENGKDWVEVLSLGLTGNGDDIRINAGDILGPDDIMELGKRGKFSGMARQMEWFPKSQSEVDRIIAERLPKIKFPKPPVYKGLVKDGRTLINRFTGDITAIEIGRQYSGSDDYLIDTLIHEVLEARIAQRSFRSVEKFEAMKTADQRHTYIHAVIKRYFRIRGWKR